MPLDFDIMLGSSPPILSQSPIFSYFNSLATARAAAAAYGNLEEKKTGSQRSWVSTMSSNGFAQAHYNNNSSTNNRNGYQNNSKVHQTGFNGGIRTNSLPPTLFSRQVLSQMDSSKRPTLDAPVRPCIILRDLPMATHTDGSRSEPTSPTKLKKRVVFADDKGLDLTQVRVMREPSSCPPRWSPDFLDLVLHATGGDSAETASWEVAFPQPAAHYKEFREHLEANGVALENVIVKAESEEISGTVKVRNLGFHKEVLVRWTADSWKTYEDVHCQYLPSGAEGTAVVNVFDTFRFAFKVPKAGKPGKDGRPLRRLDFCVCYRCDSGEFWDNNKGKNFTLEAPPPRTPPPSPPSVSIFGHRHQSPFYAQNKATSSYLKTADALRAEVPSWSEFASWNHLTNNGPYW